MSNTDVVNPVSTIVVNQAPHGVNPDSVSSFFPRVDLPTEWSDPKSRKNAFSQFEQVAFWATVEKDRLGNPYLVVAQASCSADRFDPVSLDAKSKAVLLRFSGMMVAALATVIQYTGQNFCHGRKYEIDSRIELALLPFNPTDDELGQLPVNSWVVVEGIMTAIETYAEHDYMRGKIYHTNHRGRIRVDANGRSIVVSSNSNTPTYKSGELENVKDKPVLIGEKIRITAILTKDHLLHAGYGQPYLIVATPERLREYENLRKSVSNQIVSLAKNVEDKLYQSTRNEFAALRRQELTTDEAQQVVYLARLLPVSEQPIYQKDRYDTERLREAFGVDVETHNKDQFMVFAHEVLTGIRENPPKDEGRTDQTYLYRFMRDFPFTSEDIFLLIKEMLKVRIPRLEQCGDELNESWDDRYLIENSLGTLGRIGSREALGELVQIVEYCLERGYFNRTDEDGNCICPNRFKGLLEAAFQAILELFRADALLGVHSQQSVKDWKRQLTDAGADSYVLHDLKKLVPFS